MERMKSIKETLLNRVLAETSHLDSVDTKELGEVIDMIKDLKEAIYYETVTKAMETGSSYKTEKSDHPHVVEHSDSRSEFEGKSPLSRKMYIEAKHMNKDKATQLRELEKYMQELSQDIVDMIADASPEEKQYLEKKITALASKINQMR
jgi:hypothetical protein